jgi:Uma2 family endonuclease
VKVENTLRKRYSPTMATLLTHRFTVSDYFRMAENGILSGDVRVELLDGEIVDMSPIGPFHSGSVNKLAKRFMGNDAGRWWVSIQAPLDLGEYDMPEPDLALLRPVDHCYTDAHPVAGDVFLLIEVSDSSLSFDQSVKLPLYAKHGIPEVWILNVPQRQLEVYRLPQSGAYQEKSVHKAGMVAPVAFPDAGIEVGELV